MKHSGSAPISVEFKLENELSPPLSMVPTGIMSLEVNVSVENTAAYDEEYRFAFWKQIRLASRNLNNR